MMATPRTTTADYAARARFWRGKIAGYSRSRPPEDADYLQARQEAVIANVLNHTASRLDSSPGLTADQAARLATELLTLTSAATR